MKKIWWLIGFSGLAVIQGYFVSALTFSMVVPNLVWGGLVLITPYLGRRLSLLLALWGGLWLDVIGQMYFGLRTGMLVLLTLGLWLAARWGIDLRQRLAQVMAAAVGHWLFGLGLIAALWLESGTLAGQSLVGTRFWFAALLTGVLVGLAGRRVQSKMGSRT